MQDVRCLSGIGGGTVAQLLQPRTGEAAAKRRLRKQVYLSFFAANLLTWVGASYLVAQSMA